MATAKLIPSEYYISSSNLAVSNEDRMYTDTSSTTYGTVENNNASTSYYYFYLRGFNIDDIPAGATVNSFTVKLRGRASGGYNSAMYLAHGTTTISNATATQLPNSSSAATRTFANGNLTWAQIVGYGEDFGIRINCRRNRANTKSYYYIYGAEIDVDYEEPAPSDKIYAKQNGVWVEVAKAYKKVNGVWVQSSDITNIFDAGTNYKLSN